MGKALALAFLLLQFNLANVDGSMMKCAVATKFGRVRVKFFAELGLIVRQHQRKSTRCNKSGEAAEGIFNKRATYRFFLDGQRSDRGLARGQSRSIDMPSFWLILTYTPLPRQRM